MAMLGVCAPDAAHESQGERVTGELIPFGKYKGQPLATMASDRDYCEWLLQQSWFVERFPQIHTIVVNNFGEPSETPEHNALQIRFLDDRFRAQCTALGRSTAQPQDTRR